MYRELRWSKGMGVVNKNWLDRDLLSILYICSSLVVDRCSNPRPWDPLTPGLRYKIPVFSDPAPGKS